MSTESDYKESAQKLRELTGDRTNDIKNLDGVTFEDFKLKSELMKGIIAKSFFEPTPVQAASIPDLLKGRDALIRSKNGTGKTATYLIPVLNNINSFNNNNIQALVFLPSRELVIQTVDVANELAKFTKIKAISVVGGCPIKDDIEKIKTIKPKILIGTPSRIYHLIRNDIIKTNFIKIVVFDEADQVIQSDFDSSIDNVMKSLKKCQTILISATFPNNISRFQENFMNDPLKVNLMEKLTLIGITQYYVYLTEEEKLGCLNTLFHKLNINQCIIFCNSVKRVVMLAERLNQLEYPTLAIHSKMPQSERTKIYYDFKNGHYRYLVSSDLCNRGIDVQSVNVVINFDLPRKSSTYLHRIGRSGRYGSFAISISFLTTIESKYLQTIETELKTKIEPTPPIIPEALYVTN